jgi:adenine-specific DNA-methyltransferase
MKLHQDLISVLKKDDRLVVDGKLAKNKVIELALQLDVDLLKLLRSSKDLSKTFFQQVDDVIVFDKIKFQSFVSNKQFLPDSFTEYKNKIGLISDKQYLTDNEEVVLAFPYKDCVLEGGQTKETDKHNEVFWNETLAPDEIDRLLKPKALVGFKKYDSKGEHLIKDISSEDNLIIKGNNLLALHTLRKIYKGKVKLIYIDPPYNTGNDGFNYNDNFNHSTWLVFMRNRLEIAKDLLSDDGAIFVSVDDREQAYLKVLMDEVFGRDNFINNIIWEKKFSPQNDAKYLSDNHDFIVLYAKNKLNWKINLLPRTEEMNERYSNPDNDPRGDWTSGALQVKTYSASYDYPIKTPSGRLVSAGNGSCWRFSKEKLQELIEDNRIWFGPKGDGVPRLKRFLSEVQDGVVPLTIWRHTEVGHNQSAKQGLGKLDLNFSSPKPETLLEKILKISTKEGDIVLDYHLGSGTTAVVAHKMGRKYIGIEQMDYIENIAKVRLQKVIDGEQSGISEAVNWKGGGSFVYAELAQANQLFVDKIQNSKNTKELLKMWDEMKKTAFLSYKVKPQDIDATKKDFESLSFEDQQKFLVSTLDKNLLYVPYSEIEDKTYKISKEDIALNNKFYGRN